MAIVDPEITNLLKIPIPGEDSDPFMDQFREYTRVIEDAAFLTKLLANFFIAGGGTRIWSSGTNILTWTQDWIIPVFHWGKKINVVYGPDNATRAALIPNGSALIVEVPTVLSSNVSLNFKVVSQLDPEKNNQWVAAWNNASTLQIKNLGEFT